MTARDEAIEAVYRELNGGPRGVTIYRADIERVLDVALPVLLNDLADRIERDAKWVDDAAKALRAAAEGWGA